METTFIYALCEPNSRTVRYIGKADKPAYRFKQHLRRSSKEQTHLGNWLRKLSSEGARPALVILREVPESHRAVAEERYIRIAKGLGMDLVNSTDGGEGCHNPSPETRYKIGSANRDKTPSLETRLKMSASKLGVPRSPEFCVSISKALKGRTPPAKTMRAAHTPEANEKRRKSLTGVPKSPQHRASMCAAWEKRKAAK